MNSLARRRARSQTSIFLLLAIALVALVTACSSDSTPDVTPTPTGSGQIPVENPDGTGRPDIPVLSGDARRGLDSYSANGCSTCHSGDNPELGPDHLGVYAVAGTRVEGLTADEYIEQSIRNPDAFIVPGFDSPSTMPAIEDFTDEEVRILIVYLKTLTPEDDSPRQITVDTLPQGVPEEGRRLYGSIGCSGCHSLGSDRIVGPGFKGVASRASTRKPGLTADEYIVESIIAPDTFLVEGFPRQMPTFDELSEQQIADLLAFLKTVE